MWIVELNEKKWYINGIYLVDFLFEVFDDGGVFI